jgi:hypothetical protein
MKLIYVLILLILFPFQNECQWSTDPTVNNPICLASNYQDQPQIVEDGSGGAIIVWEDFRNGSNYNIYAQRINNTGLVQWTANGVVIASPINDQTTPQIIADGNGGAIITWNDFRSANYSDIYAQRIDANGSVLWTINGVSVCSAVNSQYNPTIISSGAGGAIITWQDKRDGSLDIYVQKIDANGTALWSADGVMVCSAINNQENPTIASDGLGGVIIIWADNRNGTFSTNDYDIYAQRINADGNIQWASNGLSVCSLTGNQVYPNIINSNIDDVIISWSDTRNGIDPDIYAQKINVAGSTLWANNGTGVCNAAGLQQSPVLVDDNAGGAIITWQDYRSGAYDVYSQRINANGDIVWTSDGVPISALQNAQMEPSIISDGVGGAIITWRDFRDNGNQDVYAQRIDNNGTVQWTENGIAVCIATNDQYTPFLTSDGNGGAIIAWWDFRAGPYSVDADIYAQQVSSNGQLGVVTDAERDNSSLPESFHLNQNYPNPFNPSTKISWQSPVGSWQTIKLFDVLGREIETIVEGYFDAGSHSTLYIVNSSLPSGIYFYQLRAGNYVQTKKMIMLK